jgi:hypothetical protein
MLSARLYRIDHLFRPSLMTESLRFRFRTISTVYIGGQIRELDRLLVMFPNYTMHTDCSRHDMHPTRTGPRIQSTF